MASAHNMQQLADLPQEVSPNQKPRTWRAYSHLDRLAHVAYACQASVLAVTALLGCAHAKLRGCLQVLSKVACRCSLRLLAVLN